MPSTKQEGRQAGAHPTVSRLGGHRGEAQPPEVLTSAATPGNRQVARPPWGQMESKAWSEQLRLLSPGLGFSPGPAGL